MTRLFLKYGVMDDGKTIEILKVTHNYEEQNEPAVLMTSGLDARDDVGKVLSRIRLRGSAIPISEGINVFGLTNDLSYKPFCILVGECQFLNKHHIIESVRIVDELDIPIMAFGLENDPRNELFEGSKYLPLYADKLEELKTICWFYHKKATMNLHYTDGNPVYERNQVQVGGSEAYYPTCREYYSRPEAANEEQ